MDQDLFSPAVNGLPDDVASRVLRTVGAQLPSEVPDRQTVAAEALRGLLEVVVGESQRDSDSTGVITLRTETQGATRKGTNLFLNWKKLVGSISETGVAAYGAASGPKWMMILAGIYIWNTLSKDAEVDLSELEASVIFSLWKKSDHKNRISENSGFVATNEVRINAGCQPLGREEYLQALNTLAHLDCILLENGDVCLREKVRIGFSQS